jgi:diguanylate cyclase (GGDEF)-like protein
VDRTIRGVRPAPPRRPPSPQPPARWRDLPAAAEAGVAAVPSLAVATAAVTAGRVPAATVGLAVLLVLLALAHTELATGVERCRGRVLWTSSFDLSAMWTFAAALALPPTPAVAVVVVVHAHLWLRVWRPARRAPHRQVCATATTALAAVAAHMVVERVGGLPGRPDDLVGVIAIAAAGAAYVLVETGLAALVIGLSRTAADAPDRTAPAEDVALEVATLCLGGLVAVTLDAAPALVVFVLPPILVLHRAMLARELEGIAATDAKTGLLTVAAWRVEAGRRLARTGGAGLLIVDIDHFKAVNDLHGHLAGDEVLAAVAGTLRSAAGTDGLVGRFGGEEFVVLLAGPADADALYAAAERVRGAVAGMALFVPAGEGVTTIAGLTVSVGAARVPATQGDADESPLDRGLRAADACLYAAKRAGRNRVGVAGRVQVPAPRRSGEASALPGAALP